MPVERKNSFHLLLSDDELKLLKLLAEREGLNASDYLRTVLRRLAAVPSHMSDAIRVAELLGVRSGAEQLKASFAGVQKATKRRR